MKVLFIGPYRQNDLWGRTSRDFIKSLSLIEDISLTVRPIFISNGLHDSIDPYVLKCEANKERNHTILIQHMLPTYMIYDSRFTSIESIGSSLWNNYLRVLDKIFVTTDIEKDSLPEDLKQKTHRIGMAYEEDKAQVGSPPDRFIFYSIGGDLGSMSGAKETLTAYMSEFHINDPVSLILQSNDLEKAQAMINQVTQDLGIYSAPMYPHIHVVENRDGLHDNCNCFVNSSCSIGFGTETAEALVKGKAPIVLSGSGRDEYVSAENGFIVDSFRDILTCPDRPFAGIFTSREQCVRPNMLSLKGTMREAYENKLATLKKARTSDLAKEMLSHKTRSETIKEILCQ